MERKIERKNSQKFKGVFWERLELHDFPVDTQELSITLTTKRSPSELRLASNPNKLSFIDLNAKSIFMEQQKWYVIKDLLELFCQCP